MDAIAEMANAPDMLTLHSAFNAAKAVATGFPELMAQVGEAKDKRKAELSQQEVA